MSYLFGLLLLGIGVGNLYGNYWLMITFGIILIFNAAWDGWRQHDAERLDERVDRLEEILKERSGNEHHRD